MRGLVLTLALALGGALLAGGSTGCTTDARECGSGVYCPAGMVCLEDLGCCADPDWLAQLEGGEDAIEPAPDGGVVEGGTDPETGEPLPPMCGTAQ